MGFVVEIKIIFGNGLKAIFFGKISSDFSVPANLIKTAVWDFRGNSTDLSTASTMNCMDNKSPWINGVRQRCKAQVILPV